MPATIRDVAKLAQTSVSAVSTVLSSKPQHNIRVSAETRRRIESAAERLSYRPNRIAQTLATSKTGVLGLMFPNVEIFADRSPFSTQIMAGLMKAAVCKQYDMMLYTASANTTDEGIDALVTDRRVDGLVVVIPKVGSNVLERCRRHNVPCVGVLTEEAADGMCTINTDDFTGGRLATEYLIQLGHRRIAHLQGSPALSTTAPRRTGYFAALEAAGISPDPDLLAGHGFESQDGYGGMLALLALPAHRRPTAAFACNDVAANGALQALQANGLSVPRDFSLVGYDDTWYAEILKPHLTSVHMPIYEMGLLATHTLISLVEGEAVPEPRKVLPVHLTVRDSAAEPSRSAASI